MECHKACHGTTIALDVLKQKTENFALALKSFVTFVYP